MPCEASLIGLPISQKKSTRLQTWLDRAPVLWYSLSMASTPISLVAPVSVAATATFIEPHPAWRPAPSEPEGSSECAEYFNADGTLSEQAYDLLHNDWLSGRMV
jgi:hypothetical protein